MSLTLTENAIRNLFDGGQIVYSSVGILALAQM